MNSRAKGCVGEREVAHLLTDEGYPCRRSQQFSGLGDSSADVVGIPFIHVEVKRVQALNLDEAMAQAVRDAKEGKMPTVFHRKNGKEWKVTMRFTDWIVLYREWEASESLKRTGR